MSAVKSESHQKKKPTRQAKRKRAVVGDDDVHLINDPTHQESILIAGENDAGNILTLVSPERGTIARLEPLFDDASVSPSISPLVISDVQAPNKRFTKFKDAVTRKSSPTLDDKCVLTLLRSSFVQTSMGELKAGARKPINVRHVRRFAMHNFAASSYSKKKHINPSGNRRSTRHNLTSTSSVTECTLDMDISSMYSAFDLSSRNIRRYIIEDIMYMSVGDLVTILIDSKSVGSENWEDIANKQQFNLEVVMIGEVSYLQIPSRILSNNRKEEFVCGHHDSDSIAYLVLNKGGAGLTVEFIVKGMKGSDKCVGGVEMKFSEFFLNNKIQMWGCKPMVRNLVFNLKKRTNNDSMDSLLSCFLKELHGDSSQTVQLCASMEYVINKEVDVKPVSLSELNKILCVDTSKDSPFSTFHGKVQDLFRHSLKMCYGRYNCLHSPLIIEKDVGVLVELFNITFPYQRAGIQALLNITQKTRKRNHMIPYNDRLTMWTFMSVMNCRNKHNFTYWAMATAACKYGSKACVSSYSESIYFGHSVSQRTLLDNTSMYRDCAVPATTYLTDTCRDTLRNEEVMSIVAMDNNQRGERMKYQRGGKSSTYTLVTCMIAIKPQFHIHPASRLCGIDWNGRVSVTYINQPIPSPIGMVDYCKLGAIHSLSHIILNHDNALMQVESTPCFEGKIVQSYLNLIDYKEALIKQRKYLSRIETSFQYISNEHKEIAKGVISSLAKNRKCDGLYSQAVSFQDNAVRCWSGTKNNAQLCPLPTMAEDETTTLGTGVVLLNILHLCGLIEVEKLVDGRSKIREGKKELEMKWLYLCGDGLTQVRLKSFIDAIQKDSLSFKQFYRESVVLSTALERVVIGNGDLHAGGFSCLGTIFSACYGGFLQVFQYAMGWKRINGLDIAKSFQYGEHLVRMVSNEVDRNLHYLHIAEISKDDCTRKVLTDLSAKPVELAEYLVQSYVAFIKDKLVSSTDDILKFIINFSMMATKYSTLRNAVRKGDSVTVEAIYSYFTPIWLALGKTTYFNIALDQIDELYIKIPFKILQHVRENRFLPLYSGTNSKGVQMARWELDKIMEHCNNKFKNLDFPNTLNGWLTHAQNMPMCCKSRSFVENEYTTHHDLKVFNTKYGNKSIDDITQKGNLTKSSVVPGRTNEKIMCAEILHLGKVMIETPNRKFDNNYFWDVLPSVTTDLKSGMDEDSGTTEESHLKSIARNILSNETNVSNNFDINNIDSDVLSALIPEGVDDDESTEKTEVVDVLIGKKYKVKVNKVCHNKLSCVDIHAVGITKMTALNLTVVRLRKQQRIARERKALTEALFYQLHNEDVAGNDGQVSKTINRIKDKNDHCLFDRFTNEVRDLM